MNAPTYLFYDLETTGLSYAFDQVLQFAAIRTDASFHELERYNVYIQLRPDVIPSPQAMISHCIGLDELQHGLCEYEAMKLIHKQMNRDNTISVGYNSLGFDDEFLRFSFHRNLMSPYTHQFANRCGRMDLLPILLIYWLYKPDVLNWPEIEKKVTFKLEHLKETNKLSAGSSHDAIIDVEATVELARILSGERDIWDYLMDFFQKETDKQRISKLPRFSEQLDARYKWGVMVHLTFGAETNFQAPVVYLGDSYTYKNQSLWMRLDKQDLVETTDETFKKTPWVVRKKIGQPGIVLPPLERYLMKIKSEFMQTFSENKIWLKKNPELLDHIARYQRAFVYEDIPGVDADAILYQMQFLSGYDERLAERYHKSSNSEKIHLCDKFKSPVAKELAERILFRNYQVDFSDLFKKNFADYLRRLNPESEMDALLDHRGKRKPIAKNVLLEIQDIKQNKNLSNLQNKRLVELETYLKKTFSCA